MTSGAATEKPTVLSPKALAHVVLRTNNFEKMLRFYIDFLGSRVQWKNDHLAFLTYDEEHHRVALLAIPGTKAKDPQTCGLEHIAFTYDNLQDLLTAYSQRKSLSILPALSINHGPTTSIYYKDPDGNMLETQVDNFATAEEATKFMQSDSFAENPIGTDFDPDEFIKRLAAGESAHLLQKRVEIGPREVPNLV